MHGGSYRTYPEAREKRQQLLGDRLEQWKREERRLFQFYKLMKQRAAIERREREARRRGRDALAPLRRRRAAAGAGARPADPGADPGRRLGADRRAAARRRDRRAGAAVRGGDPLRRARRPDRPERLGQDAPDPAAGGRAGAARRRAAARQPRLRGPVHAAQHAPGPRGPRRARRRARAAPRRARAVDAGAGALPHPGRREPLDRHAVGRPEGAAGDPLPRARGPQPAAARRADRQPRHRLLRGARGGARVVRRHGRGRLPRPCVPAPAGPLPAAGARRRRLRAARHRVGAGGARRARRTSPARAWRSRSPPGARSRLLRYGRCGGSGRTDSSAASTSAASSPSSSASAAANASWRCSCRVSSASSTLASSMSRPLASASTRPPGPPGPPCRPRGPLASRISCDGRLLDAERLGEVGGQRALVGPVAGADGVERRAQLRARDAELARQRAQLLAVVHARAGAAAGAALGALLGAAIAALVAAGVVLRAGVGGAARGGGRHDAEQCEGLPDEHDSPRGGCS